jgi:hypothetical protein
MNIEDFRQVAKNLEPDAWAGGEGIEPFVISAAISLKRIADRLDDIASGKAALNVWTKAD